MSGIAAILPAFNEEISIGSVILRTRPLVDRVIVVDDGSTDRTAEVAALAGAEVIRHKTNLGKGAAIKTGYEAVNKLQSQAYLDLIGNNGLKNSVKSQNGQEIIELMDNYGQHDPADITKLIEPVRKLRMEKASG